MVDASATKNEAYLAQVPQETLDYYYSFPVWMFVLWAVGNFGGVIGAVLLLLKKGLSIPFIAAEADSARNDAAERSTEATAARGTAKELAAAVTAAEKQLARLLSGLDTGTAELKQTVGNIKSLKQGTDRLRRESRAATSEADQLQKQARELEAAAKAPPVEPDPVSAALATGDHGAILRA